MSEDQQSWLRYLQLLSDDEKLPNQTLSFVIDHTGTLIYSLQQLDYPLKTESVSTAINLESDFLSTYLPVSYQKRFQKWLTTTSTGHIICPFHLDKTVWVCVQLNNLNEHILACLQSTNQYSKSRLKVLTISATTAHRHRSQLFARISGLLGIKHDLANRLFLFKALPQLLEFSEPKELLEDIQSELPNLLDFFDHRLSEIWTESIPLTNIRSSVEFQTALETLLQTMRFRHLQSLF